MVVGKECQRSPATGRPVSSGAGWAQARSDEGRWLDHSICECAQAMEAIITLARTKLRVLWAMLKAGTLFRPERALKAA
jgi:hypothetical protein